MVRTWIVWRAELGHAVADARFASRDVETVAPYSDLAEMRATAAKSVGADTEQGALAAVSGFNPTDWTLIHFRLWRSVPKQAMTGRQLYSVGHVSLP